MLSDDRPTSAANCYPLHVRLFKFIEKTERHSIARHPAACVFALLYVPPHVSSLATPRGPAEGYSIRTNPSMTVPVATSPRTRLRAHLRRCACPPHTSHPAAAHGPAKGYFTCANPSTVVPVTHSLPQAVRLGSYFRVFLPHRLGARLRPFPLPALCSDWQRHLPRYMLVEITCRNALTCARLSLGLPYST